MGEIPKPREFSETAKKLFSTSSPRKFVPKSTVAQKPKSWNQNRWIDDQDMRRFESENRGGQRPPRWSRDRQRRRYQSKDERYYKTPRICEEVL